MSKKLNNNEKNNLNQLNSVDYKDSKTFNEWHKSYHCCNSSGKFYDAKTITMLIGSPNVGKSTFFNKISTSTASVSNIDRMTVDDSIGKIKKHKNDIIIDLPGLYNLSHPIDEELVVAHELCHEHFDKLVNVIGAQSVQRDLYLTIQTIETGRMSTLIFNMVDEVNSKALNFNKLSQLLNNVKIIPTQANRNKNIDLGIKSILNDEPVKSELVTYGTFIEKWIDKIVNLLPQRKIDSRFYALMILEGNVYVKSYYERHYEIAYKKIMSMLKEAEDYDFSTEIKNIRIKFIDELLKKCFVVNNKNTRNEYLKIDKTRQHKFDSFILNKWVGIPASIFLLILIYYISFGPYMGGSLQSYFANDFLNEIVAEKWIYALFHDVFQANDWWTNFFVYGVFEGFFSVLAFLPTIIILFTLINLIQQVGIIARLSALLDRVFEQFGLSGRSAINLLTGFGCNVPSVMMARSSNSKKEKVISILITPFVSCASRAIVYTFVCNLIFGINLGWIGTIIMMLSSGIIALSLGLLFSKTMFRKQKSFFLIEMVSWRKPDFIVIFKNVWVEICSFIKKIVLIILIANIIVWLFLHLGPQGMIGDEEINSSLLSYFGKGINWIMYPFGGNSDKGWVGNPDGWRMMTSLISAIPAKETAVSNLGLLFGDEVGTFLQSQLPIVLSYLVIFMLYVPCMATIGVIKKEGGWKILGINLATGLVCSYTLGLIVYWISYACV